MPVLNYVTWMREKNILFKVDWVDVKLSLPAVTMKVNLLAFQII